MIKHIPNTITSMNLLSGILGVILTLQGRADLGFFCMIAGACFDFCDGFAARALGAYSEIGKELDSLADMVSFGVLPSLMLFVSSDQYWRWPCLLLAVFSALRLAKFNLDERQHESFIGLPTPAAAMICGSLAYYCKISAFSLPPFVPAIIAIALGLLLISEIPMFAMKFGKGKKTDTLTFIKRTAFLCICTIIAILIALFGLNWSMIVFFSFISYIVMNLVFLIVVRS